MENTEKDIAALRDARRRAAAKLRSLLEQLEVAEREFAEATHNYEAVRLRDRERDDSSARRE